MRTRDKQHIRETLRLDPIWAAYALGDLAPGFFEHTEWHIAPGNPPALAMLYRAFDTPVLYAQGPQPGLDALLHAIRAEPALYLSVQPEALACVKQHCTVRHETAMWRMALPREGFRPAPAEGAVRLGLPDVPALEALYADGAEAGEAPDFFAPEMVATGVFYGVREGGALIAAAGTHLVAPEEGVAAVGNVYTRRDRRGRGLAARVTSAVTAGLLALRPRLEVIVLNVSQRNLAAERVYARLGYVRHCEFYEGVAALTAAPGASRAEARP